MQYKDNRGNILGNKNHRNNNNKRNNNYLKNTEKESSNGGLGEED